MKVTGSNITITDSVVNKMDILPLGNCEQQTYTGKNLINVTGFSKEENGITFTNNNDGTILVNGTATAQANFYVNTSFNVELNQSYALSGCPASGSINSYALWSNDDGSAQDNGSGVIFTPTTTNQSRISLRIRIQSGTVCNNLLFKPMLESGSSVTSWEPYVGGIPSPNPSYPQDVKVVTGENQVVVSNSDNTQSQSYTLHLGSLELCKIGDYQDVITGTKDNWKIKRYVGKLEFDGSEDENWQLSSTGASRFYLNINDLPLFKMKTSTIGIAPLCNYFIGKDNNSDFENGKILLFKSEQQSYFIRLENDNISTLEDFKTWLSTHNLILYYILATPVEETITDTLLIQSLNELYELMSYDGTTNITITSDSNNAQMSVEVTYTSESDMNEKLINIFNSIKSKLYHIIRAL